MALTALAATTAAIVQVAGFDEPGDLAAVEALVRAIRAPEGFERLMSLEAFPVGVAVAAEVEAEAVDGMRSGWAGRDVRGGGPAKAVAIRRVAAEGGGQVEVGDAARDTRTRPVAPAALVVARRAANFFVFADDPCLDRLAAASRLFCLPRDAFLATIPDWA